MAFHVVYVAGGELDKVKRVNYVDRIHNFAYLEQPYNKMEVINVPAIRGIYKLEMESPEVEAEILSIVCTCTGYGEDDYYYLWVNDELWFDQWFPTEVKEGLYIGSSTYVYKLHPKSTIRMFFVNASGTAKKVYLGVRLLTTKRQIVRKVTPIIDTQAVAVRDYDMDATEIAVPEDMYSTT